MSNGGPLVTDLSYIKPPVRAPRANIPSISPIAPIMGDLGRNFSGYSRPADDPRYYAARNQGPSELLLTGLGRFGTEVGFGIVEAAGYLSNATDVFGYFSEGEKTLGNMLSSWARETKSTLNEEYMPVHQLPGDDAFRPWSGRWWASNGPSLGSFLATLIPGYGAARLAGAGMKTLSTIAKFEKLQALPNTAKMMGRGLVAGGTQRHIESLMEANSLADELRNKVKPDGTPYTEAEIGEAGAKLYRDNMVLLGIDVFQMGWLFRSGTGQALKTFYSRRMPTVKYPMFKEGLTQAPGESFEEIYQTISSEEAKLVAQGEERANWIFAEHFGDRLDNYIKNDELWSAAMMGALGGMIAPGAINSIQQVFSKAATVTKGGTNPLTEGQTLQMLNEIKSAQTDFLRDRKFLSMMFQYGNQGRMGHLEDGLKAAKQQLESDPSANEEDIKEIDKRLEQIPAFEEIFNQAQNKTGYTRGGKFEHIGDSHTELRSYDIVNQWESKLWNESLGKIQGEYQTKFQEVPATELDPGLRDIYKLYHLNQLYELGVIQQLQSGISKTEHETRHKEIKSQLEQQIQSADPALQLDKKDLQEFLSVSADQDLIQLLASEEQLGNVLRENKKDRSLLATAKGQEKLLKKINGQIGQNIEDLNQVVASYLGEDVLVGLLETDAEQFTVKKAAGQENKFYLEKKGNPDYANAATEEMTEEEFEKFQKNSFTKAEKDQRTARLVSIANKIKNNTKLNQKEQFVLAQYSDEVDKIGKSNVIDNKGKYFNHVELQAWYKAQGYDIIDNAEYLKKIDDKYVVETRAQLIQENNTLTRRLHALQDQKRALLESLAGNEADALALQGLNRDVDQDNRPYKRSEKKIQDQIDTLEEQLKANSIKLAALTEPTKEARQEFIRKATGIVEPAIYYYEGVIRTLYTERNKLMKTQRELRNLVEDLKQSLSDLNDKLDFGKVTLRGYNSQRKKYENKLAPLEKDLQNITEQVEATTQDIRRYEEKSENVAGEVMLERKKEIQNILEGSADQTGLNYQITVVKNQLSEVKTTIQTMASTLSDLLGIPQDKLDNDSLVEGAINKLHSGSTPEVQEKIDDLLKQHKILSQQKKEQRRLEKLLEEMQQDQQKLREEFGEIEIIEGVAGFLKNKPEKIVVDKDFPDVDIDLDETALEFNPKKRADEFFYFGKGEHFVGDKLHSEPDVQRYFKFAEKFSMVRNDFYFQAVPYAVDGIVQDWSQLLAPSKERDIRAMATSDETNPNEVLNNIIFLVVVNKNGKAVGMDGKPLPDQSVEGIFREGIFTNMSDGSISGKYGKRYIDHSEGEVVIHEEQQKFLETRNKIRTELDAGNRVFFHISAKSVGLPIYESTKKPVSHIVQNPEEMTVYVNTAGEMTYESRKYNVRPGVVLVRDEVSGNVFQGVPRLLNTAEQETVYQLFQLAAQNEMLKDPFEVTVPGTQQTIREVLAEYIYFAPPNRAGKAGHVYPAMDTGGKFTGKMVVAGDGAIDFANFMDDTYLRNFISEQYHQIRASRLKVGSQLRKDRYVNIAWNGNEFVTTPFKNYQEYLTNVDRHVLESALPEWEDSPENPQKKNTNLYFDYANYELNNVPNQSKSEIKSPAEMSMRKTGATTQQKITFPKMLEAVGRVMKTTLGQPLNKDNPEVTDAQLNDLSAALNKKTNDTTTRTAKTTALEDLESKGKIQNPTESQEEDKKLSRQSTEGKILPSKKARGAFGEGSSSPFDKIDDDEFSGVKFRKIDNELPGAYPVENIEKARVWFEERFPGVEFDVVYGISATGNWGVFTEHGKVLVDPFAREGTVYHESFHVVTELYLTPAQKTALLKEWRDRNADTTSTDIQVEEELANDFMDYVLSGTLPDYLSSTERSLFEKILDFLKSLFNPSIQKTFERIQSGYYQKLTPDYSRVSGPRYREITFAGKSEAFTRDALDGVHYYFMRMFPKDFRIDQILSGEFPGTELINHYKNVRNAIVNSHELFLNDRDNLKAQLLKLGVTEIDSHPDIIAFNYALEAREFVDDNFFKGINGPSVMELHSQYLQRLAIEIQIDEDGDEELTADDPDNDWAREYLSVSASSSLSNDLKFIMSAVPRTDLEGKYQRNGLGFRVLDHSSRVFGILVNKLANTTLLSEQVKLLEELQNTYPALKDLVNYLGIGVPINRLPGTNVSRIMKFFQAMAKFRNTYEKTLADRDGEHSYVDVGSSNQRRRILSQWESEFTPTVPDDMVGKLKSDSALSFDQAVKLAFAINMNVKGISESTNPQIRERFTTAMRFIGKHAVDRNPYTENSPVLGDIHRVITMEMELKPKEVENSHLSISNKPVYDNVQHSYVTYLYTELKKIAEKTAMGVPDEFAQTFSRKSDYGWSMIFDKFPHLNNAYSRNSTILQRVAAGEIFDFSITEGIDRYRYSGREYDRLMFPDRFITEFRDVLDGRYHMIRPADNSLERLFTFGQFILIDEIGSKDAATGLSPILKTLVTYLDAELEFIREANVINPGLFMNWKNLTSNLLLANYPSSLVKNGELIPEAKALWPHEDLRGLELLQSGILLSAIASPEVMTLVENFIIDRDASPGIITRNPMIMDKLDAWFQNVSRARVLPLVKNLSLKNQSLIGEYSKFSEEILSDLFTINYMVGNLEQTMFLTGHPAQYASVDDMLKRLNGAISPKLVPNHDPDITKWVKENLNGSGEDFIRTAIVDDPIVKSKYYDVLYKTVLKEKKARAYTSIKEGDAHGYWSMKGYREFLFRNGQWSALQEMGWQWEMQGGWNGNTVTISETNPYEEIRGKEVTRADVERNGAYIVATKPQGFGPLNGEVVLSMYKFAAIPLLPSMIKGTNLEVLAEKMEKEKKDLTLFATGNKTGTKTDASNVVQNLYDPETGEISEDPFIGQNIPYQYLGIQVQNTPTIKNESSLGTQKERQIESNLFSGGVPYDYYEKFDRPQEAINNWRTLTVSQKKEASSVYARMNELRQLDKRRMEVGVAEAARRLGLVKDRIEDEDVYRIAPGKTKRVIDYLTKQFQKRNIPYNQISGLQYIENGVDMIVKADQIESILVSILEKNSIKRKRKGKNSVQVPATMFEKQGKRDYDDGRFSSSDLKFYDVEYKVGEKWVTREKWEGDGKPSYTEMKVGEMEVYLPHYFSELYGQDLDLKNVESALLSLIGFRIPTQGLSSIENIRIKGFLPPSAGDIVVVPSEIITKTGSDFDWDKLFLHFPNYRIVNGVPKYIKYSNSPEQIWEQRKEEFTKDFFPEEYSVIWDKYHQGISDIALGYEDVVSQWIPAVSRQLTALGIEDQDVVSAINELKNYHAKLTEMISEGYVDERYTRAEALFDQQVAADVLSSEGVKQILSNLRAKRHLLNKLRIEREEALGELYQKAYVEFDALDLPSKNGLQAIENKIMEIHKNMLSDHSRFEQLISPVGTAVLHAQLERLQQYLGGGKQKTLQGFDALVDPTFIIQKGFQFLSAKANIGIGAVHATAHINFGQAGVYLNLPKDVNVWLPHNTVISPEGYRKPAFGMLETEDGQHLISNILNELITSYTDAASDPFIFELNGGAQSANIFALLVMLGVPPAHLTTFMRQPIIDEYLKQQAIHERSIWFGVTQLRNKKWEKALEKRFSPKGGVVLNPKALTNLTALTQQIEKYAKDPSSLNDTDLNIQLTVLAQFKHLEWISQKMFGAIQGTTYNTKGGGKNSSEMFAKLANTDRVERENVIGNYRNLFDEGQFLYPYRQAVEENLKIMTPYFFHLQHQSARGLFEKMAANLGQMMYVTGDDRVKIMDAFRSDFPTYLLHAKTTLLQNYPHTIFSYTYHAGKRVRNDTIPVRVRQMQKEIARGERASNKLIEDLTVTLLNKNTRYKDEKGRPMFTDNLALSPGKRIEGYEIDQYAQAWRELFSSYGDLATELAAFIFIQNGLQNAPNNFISAMPHEIYWQFMSEVMSDENTGGDDYAKYFHEFFMNNRRFPIWKRSWKVDNDWPAYEKEETFEGVTSTVLKFNKQTVKRSKLKAYSDQQNYASLKWFGDQDLETYVQTYGTIKPQQPSQIDDKSTPDKNKEQDSTDTVIEKKTCKKGKE